jgi:hypothetical protein
MVFAAVVLLLSATLWLFWERAAARRSPFRRTTSGVADLLVRRLSAAGELPSLSLADDLLRTTAPEADPAEAGVGGGASQVGASQVGAVGLLSLDRTVLDALEQLTHDTIVHGLDLWTTLTERDYRLAAPGFQPMLRRHVANPPTSDPLPDGTARLDGTGQAAGADPSGYEFRSQLVPSARGELAQTVRTLAGGVAAALQSARGELVAAEAALDAAVAESLSTYRHAMRSGARRSLSGWWLRLRWRRKAAAALEAGDLRTRLDVLCGFHGGEVTARRLLIAASTRRARAVAGAAEACGRATGVTRAVKARTLARLADESARLRLGA